MKIRGFALVLSFGLLLACTSGAKPDAAAPASDAAPGASSEAAPASEEAAAVTWSLEREAFAAGVPVTDVAGLLSGGEGLPWVAVGSASEAAGEPQRPMVWTGSTAVRWNAPELLDDDFGDAASAFGVARSGDTLVAVGERWESGTTRAMVWRSADGVQWERADAALSDGSNLTEVVGSEAGFLATGRHVVDGEIQGVILESADGTQWAPVELEAPEGDSVVVADVLENGQVAVGFTRGADSRPLVWHRQGGRFALGELDEPSSSAWLSTVVRYRGALHTFGVEGADTNTAAYWRSDDGGETWQRKRAKGAYFDETLTELDSGGLDLGEAIVTEDGIYLSLSDGPALLARSKNLRRWELLWPATPKGSYYVPLFDGMAAAGSDVIVAGDHLGGAFLWRYDAAAFRWFEVDQQGEAFNRDQAATGLRALARDGDTMVAGGASGASPKTDADASVLYQGDAGGSWEPAPLKGPAADQWVNVLLETPDGLVGAGGRQPRKRSLPAVWDASPDGWQQRDDKAFEPPTGWSAFITDGAVIGNAALLAGQASDRAGIPRSVAWVRAGGKQWRELDLEQFLTKESRARLAEGDRRSPEVLPTSSTAACSLDGRGILIGSIVGTGPGASRPVVWSGPPRPGVLWRADRSAFPKGADVLDCVQVGDRLIAVGDMDGYPAIWTSTDGQTWEGGRDAIDGDEFGQIPVVAANGDDVYAFGAEQDQGVLKLRVWREVAGAWEELPDDPTFVVQEGTIEIRDAIVGDSGELTIVGALGTAGAVWRSDG